MKYAITAMLSVLVMFFQNCQKATYSGTPEYASKLVVLEQTDTEDNDPDDLPVTDNPEDTTDDTPEVDDPVDEQAEEDPGATGNLVCILDMPGKSFKLGITSENELQGQRPIRGVLCMSENACLNIASKKFAVKGAYFRGYCKASHGNKHTRHITDGELDTLIEAM